MIKFWGKIFYPLTKIAQVSRWCGTEECLAWICTRNASGRFTCYFLKILIWHSSIFPSLNKSWNLWCLNSGFALVPPASPDPCVTSVLLHEILTFKLLSSLTESWCDISAKFCFPSVWLNYVQGKLVVAGIKEGVPGKNTWDFLASPLPSGYLWQNILWTGS